MKLKRYYQKIIVTLSIFYLMANIFHAFAAQILNLLLFRISSQFIQPEKKIKSCRSDCAAKIS